MSVMTPTHTITSDASRAEVQFAIGGYWDAEGMKRFLFELGEAAKPFMKGGTPFDVLGDFKDFMPQDRATADAIRDSIEAGTRNGLRRFAVLNAAPLVRMQYRRIDQAAEVEYFETKVEALEWLRRA
jgi:hypothetical protein